jgi:hypothetical protein
MNTYPKLQEPFMFWLTRQSLPVVEDQDQDVRPMTNREFYSVMGMVVGALIVLNTIFQGLPF